MKALIVCFLFVTLFTVHASARRNRLVKQRHSTDFGPNEWHQSKPTLNQRLGRTSGLLTGYDYATYAGAYGFHGKEYEGQMLWTIPHTSMRETLLSGRFVNDPNDCDDEEADRNSTICLNRKCFYCCSDRQCYTDKTMAKDCLDRNGYCDSLCDDEFLCRLYGCSYDVMYKSCRGKKGSGTIGIRYCGERVNFQGIDYLETNYGITTDVSRNNLRCLPSRKGNVKCKGDGAQNFYYDILFTRDKNLSVELRIPSDGKYEIGLHFCDPTGDQRNMDYYLNEVFIRNIKFRTVQGQDPLIERVQFTSTHDVSKINIEVTKTDTKIAVIPEKLLKIRLKSNIPGSPVLSAAYLKKFA